MDCLICGDVIKHARMGVNSCRACAAFYKRSIGHSSKLKCKDGSNDCRERDPKTNCRKCRLKRFKEVLARAREDTTESRPKEINENSTHSAPSSFIDHMSFHDCEPTGSQTPLLDRMRKGYSLMCLIRKSGELAMKSEGSADSDIRKDNLTLTLASYPTVIPMTRVAKEAAIEFANYSFDEFRSLEEKDKRSMVESSFSMLNNLDTTYRAFVYFPGDTEMRMSAYTTYIRKADLEKFFDDCRDNIDKSNLIREFQNYFTQSRKIIRDFFEKVQPTDVEFLALFGLALWNDDTMNKDESLLSIARKVRSEIMRELHVYYAMKGTADYASRVGHIFCLLVNYQNHSEKTSEDFQVYRLMNLFESEFSKNNLKVNMNT